MSLSMAEVYTNSYSLVNANSYSTCCDTQSHNHSMSYRDWLSNQLKDLGVTPTDLSRVFDGDVLNQPTIQRILKGKTPNPRIGTVAMIEKALEKLGSKNPKYGYVAESDEISHSIHVISKIDSITVFTPPPKTGMEELVFLAEQLDTLRMGMLIKEARNLVAEIPAKQTLESIE